MDFINQFNQLIEYRFNGFIQENIIAIIIGGVILLALILGSLYFNGKKIIKGWQILGLIPRSPFLLASSIAKMFDFILRLIFLTPKKKKKGKAK